jgi:hypothetical protein
MGRGWKGGPSSSRTRGSNSAFVVSMSQNEKARIPPEASSSLVKGGAEADLNRQAVNVGGERTGKTVPFHPTVAQASLPAREEQMWFLTCKSESKQLTTLKLHGFCWNPY